MATTEPLIFVIATAAPLPHSFACMDALQEAQTTGPSTGFALRIFSKGAEHSDLGLLPVDGLLTLVRISPSRTANKAKLAGAAGMAVVRRAFEQWHAGS
jgi:hypothetical protein